MIPVPEHKAKNHWTKPPTSAIKNINNVKQIPSKQKTENRNKNRNLGRRKHTIEIIILKKSNWFFGKSSVQHMSRLIKKKRKGTLNDIRNEKDLTVDAGW